MPLKIAVISSWIKTRYVELCLNNVHLHQILHYIRLSQFDFPEIAEFVESYTIILVIS